MVVDDLAEWLGAHVAGLSYSDTLATGNVFVDRLPAGPDRAVAVYASPGTEADARLPYDPVELQVIVRSDPDGRWARSTWQAIYSKLHGLGPTTMGGTQVVFMLVTEASPTPIGDDADGRPAFSMDLRGEVYNPTDRRP